jgi:hypothetical protein
MKHFHLIEAQFKGPTNYLGAKIVITSLRFKEKVQQSYDYGIGSVKDQAELYLKDLGFKPVGYGYDEKKKAYIFCSEVFESLKEAKSSYQKKSFNQLSAKGWHKDHYNYNKAEKWERTPAKRKTPARNARR